MFWKKSNEEFAAEKAIVQIVARRLIRRSLLYKEPLQMVCNMIIGDEIPAIVSIIEKNNKEWFEKDQLLRDDIITILEAIGVTGKVIDLKKVKEVGSALCKIIT
jgi:hypothetical protein